LEKGGLDAGGEITYVMCPPTLCALEARNHIGFEVDRAFSGT
jgi:hypothetical protein